MRGVIILFIFGLHSLAFSQDKELQRKQFDFAQKTNEFLEGFDKSSGQNDFEYHSLRRDISESLLTRTTDGRMAIVWQTQPVPDNFKSKNTSFIWLAAMDLTDRSNYFDVFIDGIKRSEIVSGTKTEWVLETNDRGKLEFLMFSKDQYGDAFKYGKCTIGL